ncbi:hypothetical protein [Lyngbya confervoides]|uniref:Indoleamine 2,3-dioxygenase n=1 Tax=Lyngbya confervoides BDU141951 TaxID=1574623 RepID=A0ABD4T884_9CYAN|nr:hypothetical protein [Lyngbya confervoides]MCM1984490.1 indoleamine 2,3-dioxygenase [Lyngbya confervoides BDU141951]
MNTLSHSISNHPVLRLEDYDIHPSRGFLPTAPPALLPLTCRGLVDLVTQLPKWLTCGDIRRAVATLPELPVESLTLDFHQCRRLMLLYAFLTHAYVWGAPPPATILPRNLAVPIYRIAQRLGRPPVLSYASYALDNWTLIDSHQPIQLGNLFITHNFWGGLDEDWFILIHLDIEAKAAPAIAAIPNIQRGIQLEQPTLVGDALVAIEQAWQHINATLKRMPERCDPYIYFQRVRPFIHGWKNNPALPTGLIYEGVTAYDGQPQQFRGETGAQSAILPTMDALFQIGHAPDPLRDYLLEMRDYMPPRHRAFITEVESSVDLRGFLQGSIYPQIQQQYNRCLDLLEQFRTQHLEFAARYIQRQHGQGQNDTTLGTGGTPFMPYLKKHRDETHQHLMP